MDWNAYREPLPSLLAAVGNTPLVRLNRVTPPGHELLAKLEWYSPTGSVKDRIYAYMIERAEERGELRPGMTIMETTTGNAGIACAAVAAIEGYPCTILMPEGMSDERKKILRAYGAELILTPGGESDIEIALAQMAEIKASDPERYWIPAEFENPDNIEAHRLTSAPEILEQTDGRLDAIVAAQGTGGWISGVARFFREKLPEVKVYTAEPAECALIADRKWGTHGIAGIGDGIVPPNLDLSVIDGVATVSTEEAYDMARRLAREDGVLSGPSGGCNVTACLKVGAAHPELERIVTLIPDSAVRYFSTPLFGERLPTEVPEPERGRELRQHEIEELDRHAHRLEVLR